MIDKDKINGLKDVWKELMNQMPCLVYELTWRETAEKDDNGSEDRKEEYLDDLDAEDMEPGETVQPDWPSAMPVYVRVSDIPEEIRHDYENFFSAEEFVECKTVWENHLMLGLYKPERYEKLIEKLKEMREDSPRGRFRVLYRLIASSTVMIERQKDEIPAIQPLFLACGIVDEKKEGLPGRIRCCFIEGGERALLFPENGDASA